MLAQQFDEQLDEINVKVSLIARAAGQVLGSGKLTVVFETVLMVGNILNEGSFAGNVSGFTLESLLKLIQTKSSVDRKRNVLDYVTQLLVQKNHPATALFNDLRSAKEASRYSNEVCNSQVRRGEGRGVGRGAKRSEEGESIAKRESRRGQGRYLPDVYCGKKEFCTTSVP